MRALDFILGTMLVEGWGWGEGSRKGFFKGMVYARSQIESRANLR